MTGSVKWTNTGWWPWLTCLSSHSQRIFIRRMWVSNRFFLILLSFYALFVLLLNVCNTGVKSPQMKIKGSGCNVWWLISPSRQEFLYILSVLFFTAPSVSPLGRNGENERAVTVPAVHSTLPILTGVFLCVCSYNRQKQYAVVMVSQLRNSPLLQHHHSSDRCVEIRGAWPAMEHIAVLFIISGLYWRWAVGVDSQFIQLIHCVAKDKNKTNGKQHLWDFCTKVHVTNRALRSNLEKETHSFQQLACR